MATVPVILVAVDIEMGKGFRLREVIYMLKNG